MCLVPDPLLKQEAVYTCAMHTHIHAHEEAVCNVGVNTMDSDCKALDLDDSLHLLSLHFLI